MGDEYISKQKLLEYCQSILELTQKGIDEWMEHTLEYKQTHDYIIPLHTRFQTIEDVKLFIESLPTMTKEII